MVEQTSIVLLVDGRVQSVRTHVGLKDWPAQEEYLAGLELAEPGTQVEMWPQAVYSDIGDVPPGRSPTRWRLGPEGWRLL
jgi:hypothetical protein